MESVRTYSITADFTNGFALQKFNAEVGASGHVTNFGSISHEGDVVEVYADSLVSGAGLDAVVAAHVGYTAQELQDIEKERWKRQLFAPVKIGATCEASGLTITTDAPSLIVSDVYNVVPDPALTKYILMALVYRESDDDFVVVAFEKTNEEYATLPSGEHIARRLKEWSLIANGSDLVLEENYLGN